MSKSKAIPLSEIGKFPQHIQDQINRKLGEQLRESNAKIAELEEFCDNRINEALTAEKQPVGITPSKTVDVPNSPKKPVKSAKKSTKGSDTISMVLKSINIPYETEYRFAPPRRWRFDFAIPDKLLFIEF